MLKKINNISIIIPTLGNYQNLERLLRSIAFQDIAHDQIEIILVVNGLKNYKYKRHIELVFSKFETIKKNIIYLEKRGVNKARNCGIHASTCDTLLFLDDDCELINQKFLSYHLQFHTKNEHVFAIGGGYDLPKTAKYFDLVYNSIQMDWLNSGKIDEKFHLYLLGGNFSVKKKLLNNVSIFFDENIEYGGSEYDFFLSLNQKNQSVVKVNLPVLHHTNESIASLSRKMFKQGRGKSYIDLKHRQIKQINYKNRTALVFFNYIFWFGYYSDRREYINFILYIFRDFYSRFQRNRGDLILIFKKIIEIKKQNGDRF